MRGTPLQPVARPPTPATPPAPRVLRRLDSLVLGDDVEEEVRQLIGEWRAAKRLREVGVTPSSRCLFHGPPGTGKTATAEAVAGELRLPLHVMPLGELMGEGVVGSLERTVAAAFGEARRAPGVYVLDEVDAMLAGRGGKSEWRRSMVAAVLQQLEGPFRDSIVVMTTNDARSLDAAIWRRLDVVVAFPRLAADLLIHVGHRLAPALDWTMVEIPDDTSPADLEAAVLRAYRRAIVARRPLTPERVSEALAFRLARAAAAAAARDL